MCLPENRPRRSSSRWICWAHPGSAWEVRRPRGLLKTRGRTLSASASQIVSEIRGTHGNKFIETGGGRKELSKAGLNYWRLDTVVGDFVDRLQRGAALGERRT